MKKILVGLFLLIGSHILYAQDYHIQVIKRNNSFVVKKLCTDPGNWMLLITTTGNNISKILHKHPDDSVWVEICVSTVKEMHPERMTGDTLQSYMISTGSLIVMFPVGSGGVIGSMISTGKYMWHPIPESNTLEINPSALNMYEY